MIIKLNNNSISTMYPHIQKLFIPSLDSSLLKAWTKDFQDPDIVQKITKGYRGIVKCMTSEAW